MAVIYCVSIKKPAQTNEQVLYLMVKITTTTILKHV